MMGYKDFVIKMFEKSAELFERKYRQYATLDNTACDPLANFRVGANLKYGSNSYSAMYECAKDYARKHIAYIESHGIYGESVDESLGDIMVYAAIMRYLKARNKETTARCAVAQRREASE